MRSFRIRRIREIQGQVQATFGLGDGKRRPSEKPNFAEDLAKIELGMSALAPPQFLHALGMGYIQVCVDERQERNKTKIIERKKKRGYILAAEPLQPAALAIECQKGIAKRMSTDWWIELAPFSTDFHSSVLGLTLHFGLRDTWAR